MVTPSQTFAAGSSQGQRAIREEQKTQAEAIVREAECRLRELQERLKAIKAEGRSADPKRPFEVRRAEYDEVNRQIAEEHKRIAEAVRAYNESMIEAVRSRSLRVAGTASTFAVLDRLYREFIGAAKPQPEGTRPVRVFYETNGAEAALQKLKAGKVEVAVFDRPLSQEEEEALTKAFQGMATQPERAVFCKAALIIVVHRLNRVRSLTVKQVAEVYRADPGKWSAVGGLNRPISRIGTTYPLLSWSMFTERILDGQQIRFPDEKPIDPHHPPKIGETEKAFRERASRFPGGGPFPRYTRDAKVIDEVSKHPNGIGYCLLTPSKEIPAGIRPVRIAQKEGEEAFPPSRERILLDQYPLQETMWFLVRPDASEAAKKFVEFACSKEAAKTVEQCGLFPVVEREKMLVAQRIAEVQAGKGTPIQLCGFVGGEPLARELAVEYVKANAVVQVKYREQGLQADAVREFLDEGELLICGSEGPNAQNGTQSATLGTLAVGVVVHPDNGAKELTLEDLRLIYSGEIDKWPGVEGTAGRIRIFGLASGSGAMKLVEEVLRGDAGRPHPGPLPEGEGATRPHPQPLSRTRARGADAAQPSPPAPRPSPPTTRHARIERRGDTGKVVLSVANQPGAIGFVDLAGVSKHETTVKLVAILPPGAKTAEAPTPEKVPEGYPLARPVMLYLSPKASETAKDFFEFVAGGSAREALVAHGIIPSANPPKFAKDKTLAAVKRHFEERKPEKPEAKAAPGPEELASVVPKGPVVEEKEAGPASKGPSGEAASGKEEPAKTDRPHPNPLPEGEGASDARYFILGVVGLLVFAVALIGVNTLAAKRRRERLSRYRR